MAFDRSEAGGWLGWVEEANEETIVERRKHGLAFIVSRLKPLFCTKAIAFSWPRMAVESGLRSVKGKFLNMAMIQLRP